MEDAISLGNVIQIDKCILTFWAVLVVEYNHPIALNNLITDIDVI